MSADRRTGPRPRAIGQSRRRHIALAVSVALVVTVAGVVGYHFTSGRPTPTSHRPQSTAVDLPPGWRAWRTSLTRRQERADGHQRGHRGL